MKRDPRFDILFEPDKRDIRESRRWQVDAARRAMQAGCPGRGPRGGRPDPVDASAVTAR